MYTTFETERLVIQPTTEADAAFILELLNTPKWIQNIGDRNVKSISDAKEYIKNRITLQFERLGYSNYTISRKSDQKKIGVCGLYDRDGLDGIDLGFALLPQYEGNGYAFEAAEKLLSAAVNEFKIDTINAITTKENRPSQRLLEKLGLIFTGTVKIPGDDEELMHYRI